MWVLVFRRVPNNLYARSRWAKLNCTLLSFILLFPTGVDTPHSPEVCPLPHSSSHAEEHGEPGTGWNVDQGRSGLAEVFFEGQYSLEEWLLQRQCSVGVKPWQRSQNCSEAEGRDTGKTWVKSCVWYLEVLLAPYPLPPLNFSFSD